MAPGVQRKQVPFPAFIDYLLAWHAAEPSERGPRVYAAQSDAFSRHPLLGEDVACPPWALACMPRGEQPMVNMWLGSPLQMSPLHQDPYHNALCQVVGHKLVVLYPPGDTSKLSPCRPPQSNTSQILDPTDEKSMLRFPAAAEATPWLAQLAPGDALFIPRKWWHFVRGEGDEEPWNASVSYWWDTPRNDPPLHGEER